MKGLPRRVLRVGDTDNGLRHIVHRHHVDPQGLSDRENPCLLPETQLQRIVERIKILDIPRLGISHDLPGTKDGDGELPHRLRDQGLPLELALFIQTGKTGIDEGILPDSTAPGSGHIGGRHMGKAAKRVICLNLPGKGEDMRRAVHIDTPKLLAGMPDTDDGGGVDEIIRLVNQEVSVFLRKAEILLGDIPRNRQDAGAEAVGKLRPLVPQCREPHGSLFWGCRPDQTVDGILRRAHQFGNQFRSQKSGDPGDQNMTHPYPPIPS